MASKGKQHSAKAQRALAFWHGVTTSALRDMPIDLSARQTAVLFSIYLHEPAYSIRTLSEELGISKPAICRAVDALEKARLVKRIPDRHDGRSVLLKRTAKGNMFLDEFARLIISGLKTGI